MQATKTENHEIKVEKIKSVANSFNIYGGEIDKDALWYKVDALKDKKRFELADSARNFELNVPVWANVVKTKNKD